MSPVNVRSSEGTYSGILRGRFLTYSGYGSALGEGHNVAFFNPHGVRLENCSLTSIREVKLTNSRVGQYLGPDHGVATAPARR
jgi:hypothetical protein